MKTLSLFLSFLLVWQQPVRAQQYQEKQDVSQPQFLKNAGFENKTAGWTVASGTKTFPTAIGDKISGQGFKLAFTSINGTLLQQTYSDCADLNGKNLLAGIHIKTPSSNVEVCSQVNGADYQCVAVPSGGSKLEWTPVTMVAGAFTCGMRVKTTSSTSGDITVDAARLEENKGTGNVVTKTPNIVKYTSSSGTYIPSVGTQYIRVRMVGGGGGGAGGGATVPSGGNGGSTTFGTSLLSANGGVGSSGTAAPAGGTASIAAPAYGTSVTGSRGGVGSANHTATSWTSGGNGGASPFGGAGAGGIASGAPSAAANSGSGGGGGAGANVGGHSGASGGGAGGFVDAIIPAPLSTSYTYTVGTGGTAGSAGTSGYAGGAGGSGYIEITEYFDTVPVVEYPAANILGTVFIEPKATTCRPGSVKLDGSTLSGSQYSALIAYNGTATLKNWSAVSPRGTGTQSINGRTKTGPTNPGDLQEDQFQGHWHTNRVYDTAGGTSLWGPTSWPSNRSTAFSTGYSTVWTGNPIVGDHGSVRYGAETRGNSIGVTWCQWYVSQASQLIKQAVVAGDAETGVTRINRVTSVSASSYTVTTADETISTNSTSNVVTLGLPPASSVQGKKYHIVNTASTNSTVLDPNSTETICGSRSSIALWGAMDGITIQSNGTTWIALDDGCSKKFTVQFGATKDTSTAAGNCAASPCNIWRQSSAGAVSSVTRAASGRYDLILSTSGSDRPICSCSGIAGGVSEGYCRSIAATLSAANLAFTNAGGAATDAQVVASCSIDR